MTVTVTVTAVLVLVLALVVGTGLWRTADRLDRLHHRIEVARATLAAQLLRRSGVVLELAAADVLDPASRLLLLDAAHRARNAAPDPAEAAAAGSITGCITGSTTGCITGPADLEAADLEAAESALSEALRAVLADPAHVRALRADPGLGPLVEELARTSARVELARRFHNDTVVAARALRARRRVRWLRLAGRAGPPSTVDLDDASPPALVSPP